MNKRINEIKEQIKALYTELNEIRDNCDHTYEKIGDSAHCSSCGEDGGWWCPDSPTHICEYIGDNEHCMYCGEYDERK